jgi:y4mF family transcriptional regulator
LSANTNKEIKSSSGHFLSLSSLGDFHIPPPMNIVSVNDLAASVRQARRKLGWTQAELAERSGVSRDWIIGLEKAKPSQEIALVLRTLKALDLNLSLCSQEERTWTQKALFPSRAESVVNLDDLLKGDGGEGNTP